MTKSIIAAGEVLFDDFGSFRRFGGAAANFAIQMAKLDFEVFLYSAVGNDEAGDEILKTLTVGNVRTDLVGRVPYPTGRVAVTLRHGKPEYEIIENTAWDHIPLQKTTRCDALYFGTLVQRSAESQKTVLKLLTELDCFKILDINLRQNYFDRETIELSLQHADLLKINDEELPVLAQMFDLPTEQQLFAGRLAQYFGLDTLVITLGKHGSAAWRNGEWCRCPETPCVVVNTVGAGDAFCAAFTAAILNGKSLLQAQKDANDLAAAICSRH